MKDKTEIDNYFRQVVQSILVPGIVAIAANKDDVLYHNAFGKQNVEKNIDMQKDSIFKIMSMTKPITSAAVMMLYEQGKIGLHDPVSKYIPSFKGREVITHFSEADCTYESKPCDTEITIHHLLTHTSGIGYSFSNKTLRLLQTDTGKTPMELPLMFKPGARWMYGMNTRILGRILEIVSDSPLDKYLYKNIIGPLGMNDTCYELSQEQYSRLVTTHQRTAEELTENQYENIPEPDIAGDHGLFSTASDYVKFLQMLLNKGKVGSTNLLSEEMVNLMMQNQIGELTVDRQTGVNTDISREFPLGSGKDKFGYGFQITTNESEDSDMRSNGSCSWAGLYNTHFWVDPKKEVAGLLMMQVLPFYDEICMDIYKKFEKLVYELL